MRYPPSGRGFVLPVTLVICAAVMTAATAFFAYFGSAVRAERAALIRAQARQIAEGGVDEAIYRLNHDAGYSGENGTALGAGTFDVSVSGTGSVRTLAVTGSVPNRASPLATKTVTVNVSINTSVVSFRYGVQVGDGGVTMNNGSTVNGNLFSNGSVSGIGTITGDATVAMGSATTSLSGITVNGNVWAYALSSCTISGSASYGTMTGCSVAGTKNPGITPAAPAALAIPDNQIAAWEATAAGGGVITGPYTVSGTQTMGPKKIEGNLTVTNGAALVLSGPVWVNGNVTISNNASLLVSPATGSSGAILIADKTGGAATGGGVVLSNNISASGNGTTGSFPMIISMNTGNMAISISNNAASVILYAPHGGVDVSNGASANEITAKSLALHNNSSVNYQSGLQSASFSNGPGGSWTVVRGTYAITR